MGKKKVTSIRAPISSKSREENHSFVSLSTTSVHLFRRHEPIHIYRIHILCRELILTGPWVIPTEALEMIPVSRSSYSKKKAGRNPDCVGCKYKGLEAEISCSTFYSGIKVSDISLSVKTYNSEKEKRKHLPAGHRHSSMN